MKKIVGLDLGTTSIGWSFINEAENDNEASSIVNTGVRIVPLTTDEEADFKKGNTISINADRTLKRGARRGLQRFKQRRNALYLQIMFMQKLGSKLLFHRIK
jgi:CRISPR-associated endonuclease Csn1